MEDQQGGDAEVEFGMLCLVAEGVHAQKGAKAAADCRDGHQSGFGDAPFLFYGFTLVRKHKEEAGGID